MLFLETNRIKKEFQVSRVQRHKGVASYNMYHNSIDITTFVSYKLQIALILSLFISFLEYKNSSTKSKS